MNNDQNDNNKFYLTTIYPCYQGHPYNCNNNPFIFEKSLFNNHDKLELNSVYINRQIFLSSLQHFVDLFNINVYISHFYLMISF